jgi:hypothetical protein
MILVVRPPSVNQRMLLSFHMSCHVKIFNCTSSSEDHQGSMVSVAIF